MTREVPLTLTADLSEALEEMQPVSVSAGSAGEAVLLV
jgi:hypothetical protein